MPDRIDVYQNRVPGRGFSWRLDYVCVIDGKQYVLGPLHCPISMTLEEAREIGDGVAIRAFERRRAICLN